MKDNLEFSLLENDFLLQGNFLDLFENIEDLFDDIDGIDDFEDFDEVEEFDEDSQAAD